MDELNLKLKLPPIPENGSALAEIGADAAREVSTLSLDYSPESLVELDALIERLSEDALVSQVAETLFCLGCYLGEVLIRNLDGQWVAREGSKLSAHSRWPLVIEMQDGHAWNPIGKVFKRFELGSGENLSRFFSTARAGAANARK